MFQSRVAVRAFRVTLRVARVWRKLLSSTAIKINKPLIKQSKRWKRHIPFSLSHSCKQITNSQQFGDTIRCTGRHSSSHTNGRRGDKMKMKTKTMERTLPLTQHFIIYSLSASGNAEMKTNYPHIFFIFIGSKGTIYRLKKFHYIWFHSSFVTNHLF